MSFFKFLFSKAFFLQLVIAGVVSAGLIYLVIGWLDSETNHDVKVTVPSIVGLMEDDMQTALIDKGFKYVVSTYENVKHKPEGQILAQTPKSGEMVKPGRTIYLTLNKKVDRMVSLSLVEYEGLSGKIVVKKLREKGFDVIQEPISGGIVGFAKEIHYKGKKLGDKKVSAHYGDQVTVYITQKGNEKKAIGNYKGLSVSEAIAKVQESSLNALLIHVGDSTCISKADTMNAIIVRQGGGEIGKQVSLGSDIELYFTCDSLFKK